MKKRKIYLKIMISIYFIIGGFLLAIMAERIPVAVSPGSDRGMVLVDQRCPTFSWSAFDGAASYQVAIFEVVDSPVMSYEEMKINAPVVLNKYINSRALSWTPSADEGLTNGVEYVWYIQAIDENGQGLWSEGRFFKVRIEGQNLEIQERLRQALKKHGVSEEIVNEVFKEGYAGIKDDDHNISDTATTLSVGSTLGQEGESNTLYGYKSGFSLTSGSLNTFIGSHAGYNNTSGVKNTFLGYGSGLSTTTGNDNTFLGFDSGAKNSTGKCNIFMGSWAGFNNTTGYHNSFLGYYAGYANITGYFNTFFGSYAGQNNTTGHRNVFQGYYAGSKNTTGYHNTFLGSYAGLNNTSGYKNVFLGYYAGFANTTGNENLFLGYYAGSANTIGYRNSFLGYYAGSANTAGYDNTFLGYRAGEKNSTGNDNTFLGHYAGHENTTGIENVFLGDSAGSNNITGDGNIFMGFVSGQYNTDGYQNAFVGSYSGYLNTTGFANTFIGYQAGNSNQTGGLNIGMGYEAGFMNHTGNGNVFLGTYAGFYEQGSNKLYIANTDAAFPLIYGEFDTNMVSVNGRLGVGVQNPQYLLHLTGGAYSDGNDWYPACSREYKENIIPLNADKAMKAIEELNPVEYNYKVNKDEKRVGFIAEEIPDLVALNGRKNLSTVDILAVLTKVVKEQQKSLSELKQEIIRLKKNRNTSKKN